MVSAAPHAQAANRTINTADPPSVMQGDTVLLTLTGDNLPTGTIIVEFFPQQIAVLKILSATANEVIAQIKVPSMAPPGQYNIIVYNQLGEEAFAKGLLTVGSGLITPVFTDFDPHVIAEATSGFALMLTGESITPAVIDHLAMEWQLGEQRLTALHTTFGMGGTGTIVCAVSGKPPVGQLRGRIYMDSKPIFLVDLKIEGQGMAIVGHSPAELPCNSQTLAVKILGANLDAQLIPELTIALESASLTAKAAQVELADAASLRASFTGPLPVGEYTLTVTQGKNALYSGTLSLVPDTAVPPAETLQVPAPGAAQAGTETQPPATPIDTPPAQPVARITSIKPLQIPAGAEPFKITCAGEDLGALTPDQLTASLVIGDAAASLLFAGTMGDALTLVFGPPNGAWQGGQSGTLSITDPQGRLAEFSAPLSVAAGGAAPAEASLAELLDQAQRAPGLPGSLRSPAKTEPTTPPSPPPAAESSTPAAPAADKTGWQAQAAYVTSGQGSSTLSVTLSAPQSTWDPALLKGSFSLLPKAPRATEIFSNLALKGQLAFRRSDAGMPVGEFVGNFLAGDLLLTLSYAGGPPEISVLALDAPLPAAKLSLPTTKELQADPNTGRLYPETLRCVVDFAPLIVTDPNMIKPLSEPAVDLTKHCSAQAQGTQVTLELDLAAWQDVRDWSQGLDLALHSDLPVNWSAEPKLHLAVSNTAIVEQASATIALQPALIDDKGFVITCIPQTPDVAVAGWADVQLSSAFMLLDRNAAQFSVVATSAELLGQPSIRLRFRRDPAKLSDAAYALLRDALLAEQSVPVKLEWPRLGCSAEAALTFEAAGAGALDDLLQNLGTGAAN